MVYWNIHYHFPPILPLSFVFCFLFTSPEAKHRVDNSTASSDLWFTISTGAVCDYNSPCDDCSYVRVDVSLPLSFSLLRVVVFFFLLFLFIYLFFLVFFNRTCMEIILLKYLDSYIPIRDIFISHSKWFEFYCSRLQLASIACILHFHQLRSHKYYENAWGLFATYFSTEWRILEFIFSHVNRFVTGNCF